MDQGAWWATDHGIAESDTTEQLHFHILKMRAAPVAQVGKNLPAMWETWVRSLGWEAALEKGIATYPSILA